MKSDDQLITEEISRFHRSLAAVGVEFEDARAHATTALWALTARTPDAPGAWRRMAIRSAVIKAMQAVSGRGRAKREALLSLRSLDPTVLNMPAPEIDRRDPWLAKHLARLTPVRRTILQRMFWADATLQEVADELGRGMTWVWHEKRRALRDLRRAMEGGSYVAE